MNTYKFNTIFHLHFPTFNKNKSLPKRLDTFTVILEVKFCITLGIHPKINDI